MTKRLPPEQARAVARNLRVSPRKLNEVAVLIRGVAVPEALNRLTFSHRRIAGAVRKTLLSAVSNAENNHGLDIDRLRVSESYVGKGLVMRRFRPRARGRGARIVKPFSHLTIVVEQRSSSSSPPSRE